MAIMPDKIVLAYKTRPCLVDGKRALWHRWVDRAEVVPPSIMRGGHGGGQLACTVALVELFDGTVKTVYPERVRFLDTEYEMSNMEGDYMLAEERGLIEKEVDK